MADDEVDGALEQSGKIVVEVQRGRETLGKNAKPASRAGLTNDAEGISKDAKEIVKDGHVPPAVKYVVLSRHRSETNFT